MSHWNYWMMDLRGDTEREISKDTQSAWSAVVEFPNDLEIVVTRAFDAPIELVCDVWTKPEHVRKHPLHSMPR
jgi:hypothetical protein